MVKKKRGWWSQIQSGDYPEGQKKYGDNNWITFNIKKNAPIEPRKEEEDSEKSLCQLHNNCPNCGKLYFKDKGKCYSCGWSLGFNNVPIYHVKNETQPEKFVKEKILSKTNYAMLCPKCGAKMILRTATRGENKGNKFWGCSQFPKCRGTSSYREIS
jgi:ssDNA-binding Zn-finger/Zn-ribbon topoisomerase 1